MSQQAIDFLCMSPFLELFRKPLKTAAGNECHNPAGSLEGGQFCGPGGGSVADDPNSWDMMTRLNFLESVNTLDASDKAGDKEVSSAIRSYNSIGYTGINGTLRGTVSPADSGFEAEDLKTKIKNLDLAFDKYGETFGQPTSVYRGISKDSFNKMRLTPGTRITDSGFSSTSLMTSIAGNFSTLGDDRGIIFRIRIKGDEKFITGTKGESEIIFKRGSSFDVIGSSELDDVHKIRIWDLRMR